MSRAQRARGLTAGKATRIKPVLHQGQPIEHHHTVNQEVFDRRMRLVWPGDPKRCAETPVTKQRRGSADFNQPSPEYRAKKTEEKE